MNLRHDQGPPSAHSWPSMAHNLPSKPRDGRKASTYRCSRGGKTYTLGREQSAPPM